MVIFHISDDIKALRETLCQAQSLASLLPQNVNMSDYLDHLQHLVDQCDIHRPLGPDGRHGDRHTETCGCIDEVAPKSEPVHGNWCNHRDCSNCWRSFLRGRKCLVCGHDWANPFQTGAEV